MSIFFSEIFHEHLIMVVDNVGIRVAYSVLDIVDRYLVSNPKPIFLFLVTLILVLFADTVSQDVLIIRF